MQFAKDKMSFFYLIYQLQLFYQLFVKAWIYFESKDFLKLLMICDRKEIKFS